MHRYLDHSNYNSHPTLQRSHYHFYTLSHFTKSHRSPSTMSSNSQYADAPTEGVVDDDYHSRTGQSAILVQKDGAPIESTEYDNGGDSDQQLGKLLISPYLTALTICRKG
jgi:hypothetical protein